jgi:hypothetical protein
VKIENDRVGGGRLRFSCGLRAGGVLRRWGYSGNGQRGNDRAWEESPVACRDAGRRLLAGEDRVEERRALPGRAWRGSREISVLAESLSRILWFIIGIGVAIGLAIVVLGWLAGRLFPKVRYVAPFAVVALAYAWLGHAKDRYWDTFIVPWFLAAAAVALYWAVRRPRSARSPPDGPHR